jgi:hypothetical protein
MAHPFTHSIHAHSVTLNQTVMKPDTLIMDSAEARLAADIWAAAQTGADDWVSIVRVCYVPADEQPA